MNKISKSIQHKYDIKIEEAKATLSKEVEVLKSELDERKTDIIALKASALSNLSQRQSLVFEKQVHAAEVVWEAKTSLANRSILVSYVSRIDWSSINQASSRNNGDQKMCKMLLESFDIKELKLVKANMAQPFVSPMVWAYFSAYRAIFADTYLRLKLIAEENSLIVLNNETTIELLKTTLPEQSEFIEEHRLNVYDQLLEHVSDKLLVEISTMLSGEDMDKASVKRAGEISKEANKVMELLVQETP